MSPPISSGEKGKARDILNAIRTLKRIEAEGRAATEEERDALRRFSGFGPVALVLFPDPVTGTYKDATWQALGEALQEVLTADEYASAKKTVFNAFYTSPVVVAAMHAALQRLGVPRNATVLEPGCGSGNFLAQAAPDMKFIGIELDAISGRIARVLYPAYDIRIESFRDTRLPEGGLDAVIGNPPFADVKFDYQGLRMPLHDFFLAKSLDALKPGGVLALVTSHFTLDKQNAAVREFLGARADFEAAIRLPSDAFKREGTAVVTDILILRKRASGQEPNHADPAWLATGPLTIEGVEVAINRYFLNHPEQVLGTWSRQDRLYGGEGGYSLTSHGDLAALLDAAIRRLPEWAPTTAVVAKSKPISTFTPPPSERLVTEGGFFVGEDRVLYQVTAGRPEPVIYWGTTLRADGTANARRFASLIGLRDLARRVLQSQNEDWPDADRDEARRNLNRAYDRFVAAHGPINKTTFTATQQGGTIRRMPNLVKFREDPDAMLVMALEDYDETSGKATKAAILLRDVVGRPPPLTEVTSAEAGLLASLDQRGAVDLPYIAALYGRDEAQILRELGDLIYRDPATGAWETADAYLSGNVRAKLAAAERAGPEYARNIVSLQAVQPEDVLPGDIDANLGAPWIPESDIAAFAGDLFGVPASAIAVGHLKKDAVWTLEAGYAAVQSVAATADYGTARANGVTLLDQALNLKTPAIYDTVLSGGGREERVVNPEETLAAKEKQKRIKERFRSWVFAEPERAERLVRVYNDTYNNLRPRLFDGSHLEFPGLNRAIELRPHQKDAIWRSMSGGNTLLAHAVGAGKTFTMAASGMKMKQAGLIRKPLFVVPNHMLEQFSREFVQLYPDARLLVASKEDMTRERRKSLTAKIAGGEWDGIVTTHSSFERIGMSRDYQARFLREQVAEYESLLVESARSGDRTGTQRNLIKTIEKQKARREERLHDLLAEAKKDDGLVFDELGVDHLFVDEAHYFKNLETPTKMDRVAGIQTGGSERAFDLYMKARYLGERHPGHGVTFATGTPISNTMVEMFTMQKFLDPEGLASRGLEHFDAWAATFGEVVDAMEISPDGASLRPRSRFAKFTNIPELQAMFRAFSDVQTAEKLDLPRPALQGGKPFVVACPMSDEQAVLQRGLIDRYERIRSEKVDPREDNALAITTDGRKLALDARMLAATAPDHPGSKVNALVANVAAIWSRTTATRGVQLIFCDMGINPTPWGYSAYDEVTAKLAQQGVPRDQIATVGEADTDAKKQALFDKVRSGSVRVLLGSTQKMGTGTNVQKRLVALHHLDAPWKPAEVEQREGRILRQGNTNDEVAIYRYVTEGSFDAYMWQALETKARFIAQVMTGDVAVRRAEDVGGQELSYAEVKAIASGNPAVLTLAEADAELQRLAILARGHADEQFLARRNIRELPEMIADREERLERLTADLITAQDHADDPIAIGGRRCRREEVMGVLGDRLEAIPELVLATRRFELGRARGLEFGIVMHPRGSPDVYLEGVATRRVTLSREAHGPRAVINAVNRLLDGAEAACDEVRRELDMARGRLADYQDRLGRVFPHEARRGELTELRDALRIALAEPVPGQARTDAVPERPSHELAERIRLLLDVRVVEAPPPERRPTQAVTAERPVTARIRERMETGERLNSPSILSGGPDAPEGRQVERIRGSFAPGLGLGRA